jgi:uncharacterized membrane protein YphA (DoxX/SURF4 family)
MYALASQIFSGLFLILVSSPPNYSFQNLGHVPPMRDITFWVARRVFGEDASVVFTGNSGDSEFYWAQTLWVLAFAVIGAAAWTIVDRRRGNYSALYQWFTVFIRIALGAQMMYYGMAKAIPTQFPAPSLVTLVTPVGQVSLQGLLWTSIGASPAYQVFTGLIEVVAGALLFIPAAAPLGAAISAAVMVEILTLNLTYDIGLKQISFHLLLMCVFLLAPLYKRVAAIFAPDRAPAPEATVERPGGGRRAVAIQIALGVCLLGMYSYIARSWWYSAGAGTAKSPLYGVWNIHRISVDGVTQPAVLNDYDRRWRRVIFDGPHETVFQRTDDSFARYTASIDTGGRKLTLFLRDGTHRADFAFQQPAGDRLTLEGAMDGHAIHMELERVELDTFRLLESDFRWVRPPDPNTVPN